MSEQHGPHEHFEPRGSDMWCDALDRAYGELNAKLDRLINRVDELEQRVRREFGTSLAITDELRDRVQQLEQREEYREVRGSE